MLGVLANTIAVLIGSAVGLLFKKGIPEKYSNAVMTGIALCTVYIGISGALKGENTIVLIVSMALVPIYGIDQSTALIFATISHEAQIVQMILFGLVAIVMTFFIKRRRQNKIQTI